MHFEAQISSGEPDVEAGAAAGPSPEGDHGGVGIGLGRGLDPEGDGPNVGGKPARAPVEGVAGDGTVTSSGMSSLNSSKSGGVELWSLSRFIGGFAEDGVFPGVGFDG